MLNLMLWTFSDKCSGPLRAHLEFPEANGIDPQLQFHSSK